jgi:hypothetical protein
MLSCFLCNLFPIGLEKKKEKKKEEEDVVLFFQNFFCHQVVCIEDFALLFAITFLPSFPLICKQDNMADLALAAAGIVLSPFLQVFFERMASREFDDFFRGRKLSNKLLRKLKIALLSVNAVLEDAEDRQFTKTSVKEVAR